MSVCDCSWGGDYILGACVLGGGARTCRTPGKVCPNCGCEVKVGQRCIDHAGIWEDDGWCSKYHAECFELMELFADKWCGGEWSSPFDIVEAADHAVSQGDDPFWKEWLFLYEKTWAWTPEPPDPPDLRPLEQRWESYKAQQPEFKPTIVGFDKVEVVGGRADAKIWEEK